MMPNLCNVSKLMATMRKESLKLGPCTIDLEEGVFRKKQRMYFAKKPEKSQKSSLDTIRLSPDTNVVISWKIN